MKRRPDESSALRALRASLTEEGGGHPAEELLLEYADKRSSLAEDVVASIDAHLAECASCRDEVGVLDSMTIRPVSETLAAEARAERSVWQRIVSAARGPVWRPALAFAILVVLMVPTLRRIGLDRALMLETADRHDDVAMTVNEERPFQPPRTGEPMVLDELVTAERETQTPRAERQRATPGAPAAPASSAKAPAGVRSTPPPTTEAPDAAPSSTQPPRVADSVMDQRGMLAARERESHSRNAFGEQAIAKPRDSASPPAFDYVPGGRVSITRGNVDRVTLRINFVRESARPTEVGRSSSSLSHETTPAIVLAPTVSELDLRVTTADGRTHARRVELGVAPQGLSSKVVDIPADWLAAGENRVDVSSREDRPRVFGSLVVTLPSRD